MISSPISLSSIFSTLHHSIFTVLGSAASPGTPPCSSRSFCPETWSKTVSFFPHYAVNLLPASVQIVGCSIAPRWTLRPLSILYIINYPPLFHLILLSIILLRPFPINIYKSAHLPSPKSVLYWVCYSYKNRTASILAKDSRNCYTMGPIWRHISCHIKCLHNGHIRKIMDIFSLRYIFDVIWNPDQNTK